MAEPDTELNALIAEQTAALKAMVMIALENRHVQKDAESTPDEVLLTTAGFTTHQVAELLGSTSDAVRMKVSRYRRRNSSGE